MIGLRLLIVVGFLAGTAHSVAALPAPTPSYIAISFADGASGIAELGLPALAEHNLRATAFVPTGLVGTHGQMTLANLEMLAANGWDVASHLDYGGDPTQMPPDELLGRLVSSHEWLEAHGFEANIFGPPGQKWATALTPMAVGAGYSAILASPQRGGVIPLGLTPVFRSCASAAPLDEIAVAIQRAKSIPGRLLILSFHNIVASQPRGTEADVQRLEAVLDLAVASGLPILAISALMSPDAR
jgi:hypothetical protein